MFQRIRTRRRGFTLLELVVTTSLVGITVTAIATLLRSSVATWDAAESDRSRLDAAHSVVRHFVRGLRQAQAVTAVSAPTATNGTITITTVSNQTASWSFASGRVFYTQAGVTEEIANQVTELSFNGLKGDGTTATDPADVRSVRITITVSLDRDVGNARTIRSTAWLRVKG